MSEEIKQLPQSEEAEKALLGSMIQGGSREQEIAMAWVRNDDAFYNTDCKDVWKSIKILYKDGIDIDFITLADRVQEDTGKSLAYFITGLIDFVPSKANVENYAKIVWQKYIQRETAKSATKLVDASYESNGSVKEILSEHNKLIEELKNIQPSKQIDMSVLIDDMKDVMEQDSNLIPFNLAHLDSFAGGMTRKEITVVGGRPGHGKTTLVINIIRGLIYQGYNVMLFNREMSNTEMLKKMVVMESKELEYGVVRRNELEDNDKETFDTTSEMMKDKYKNLTMYDNIRSLNDCLREISKHKPDVVIDDYIQLIQVDDIKEGRRFEIEKIMQEYKWISKSENCSVILVSQLNREIEKRLDPRPRMSDYAEIIVAKSRYGRIGTHQVGFNGGRCKFYMNDKLAKEDSK